MSFSKRSAEKDFLRNYYCDEIHLMDHIPYIALLVAILVIFRKSLLQYADE